MSISIITSSCFLQHYVLRNFHSHFIFIRSLMEHWNVSLVNFAQNSVLPGWEVEPQLSGCRPMEESILFRF